MDGAWIGLYLVLAGCFAIKLGVGSIGAILITVGLLIAAVSVVRSNPRESCPERLCTSCYVTAQPVLQKDGRMWCPGCGADELAPLDSQFAKTYYAQQQADTQPRLRRWGDV